MFKSCRICQEHLSLDKYNKDSKGVYGRSHVCRECRKKNVNGEHINPTTKIRCKECKIDKDIKGYYKCSRNKTGLQNICMECQKKRICASLSKISNYLALLLRKFIKRNKNKKVTVTVHDLMSLLEKQQGKCSILNINMTHSVDNKKRIDDIWNIAIYITEDTDQIGPNEICLVCNLCDTIKRGYNITDRTLMNNILSEIVENN